MEANQYAVQAQLIVLHRDSFEMRTSQWINRKSDDGDQEQLAARIKVWATQVGVGLPFDRSQNDLARAISYPFW